MWHSLLQVLKESLISSNKNFSSAHRYKPQESSSSRSLKPPLLLGAFFLFIALDYFTFSLISLGAGEVFSFLLSLGLMGAVLLSFILLRKGEKLHLVYENSKYAKAPLYPLKLIGALLLSIATTLSAYFGEYDLMGSMMLGASVLGGWYLYYGFDATEDKLAGYSSDAAAQRIMTLIVESQKRVENIRSYAGALPSKDIGLMMQEVADGFSKIIEHIELEPEDYDVARKYLVSYLGEIETMSEIFSKLDINDKSAEMKKSFRELLEITRERLNKQYDKLLDDDILEFDIKMSVMKKRFKGEE